MEKKTKREILELVASTYNAGNRSVEGRCLYNGPDGKHCAFALLMIDPSIINVNDEGEAARTILGKYGMDILKEEYRGYSYDFYSRVQRLHDIGSHWDTDGISQKGKEYIKEVLEY